ncbi:hypothetical protein SAMN05216236_1602 [Sedimentitalea nanhaiensis]|uniref:Uncharacterized protein n=1 Tax=Sedimentitalea nanhaiensis TaxID=999627 RepID=A0A1I7EBR4_9RHOB|nr:hypothetical protein SAMN05216236_1602 [Sedimentitalea nanhaiensis]
MYLTEQEVLCIANLERHKTGYYENLGYLPKSGAIDIGRARFLHMYTTLDVFHFRVCRSLEAKHGLTVETCISIAERVSDEIVAWEENRYPRKYIFSSLVQVISCKLRNI